MSYGFCVENTYSAHDMSLQEPTVGPPQETAFHDPDGSTIVKITVGVDLPDSAIHRAFSIEQLSNRRFSHIVSSKSDVVTSWLSHIVSTWDIPHMAYTRSIAQLYTDCEHKMRMPCDFLLFVGKSAHDIRHL